jgi:hypothetical protein
LRNFSLTPESRNRVREAKLAQIGLMVSEGIPEAILEDFRAAIKHPALKLDIVKLPNAPYAGLELYMPAAIGLFVATAFFTGFLGRGLIMAQS